MRKFVVTINGKAYDVDVEEVGVSGSAMAAPVVPVATAPAPASAPAAAPAAPAAAAPAPSPAAAPAGATAVNSPMPGNILKIHVGIGDSVKRGDILLILEAMKMENEIIAPDDGTVASVNVAVGAVVNAGDLLISFS